MQHQVYQWVLLELYLKRQESTKMDFLILVARLISTSNIKYKMHIITKMMETQGNRIIHLCLLMDHCDQSKQCCTGRTCLGHTAKVKIHFISYSHIRLYTSTCFSHKLYQMTILELGKYSSCTA